MQSTAKTGNLLNIFCGGMDNCDGYVQNGDVDDVDVDGGGVGVVVGGREGGGKVRRGIYSACNTLYNTMQCNTQIVM